MVDLLEHVATLERTLMVLVQHLAVQTGRDVERLDRAIAERDRERTTATDFDRMERNTRDDMRIRVERTEELLEQLSAFCLW
jgi:hypothetical protein